MNILELDSYNLADAVKFNDQLNPRIWSGQTMRPEVRAKLLEIAQEFKEFLGVSDLQVKDITVSGSNAGYTYTPYSDIDLHLVVDLPEADRSDVYRELFDAKKYAFNDQHNIKIGDYEVELYVENANKSPVSQGVFSVLNNDWINIPKKRRATIDDDAVRSKYEDLRHRIDDAVRSDNSESISSLAKKIKTYRQAGLDAHGELGAENLAYKMLRNQGYLKKLYDARAAARDKELSLAEQNPEKKPVVYGFKGMDEDATLTPGGVGPTTDMFLTERPIPDHTEIIFDFMHFAVHELELHNVPTLKIKKDPQWSVIHKSFGRYRDDLGQIELAVGNRHIMDVLRTLAHELQHRKQDEREHMPPGAGKTGSPFENEAHAVAGILMRKYADLHPEYFEDVPVSESASGYIPTAKEKNDPRYKMALTQDIKPGQVGKEANKMALQTDSQGRPKLLIKSVNLREGRAYDTSRPRGPETPPTMPAGTVRIDVSDMYDWYKLGQHISNMKGLGKHDFGAGPPSSIVSFGDEDTEHQFIKDLEATGLDVTDIDPRDPKQPPGMRKIKTDPTYNVDEDDLVASLRREFELLEDEMLGEINMSPSNLENLARQINALSGMEFEMIVPNASSGDDEGEQEPDYNEDRRVGSLSDVEDFFYEGDYNSRSDVRRLIAAIQEEYEESLYDDMSSAWADQGLERMLDYVNDNKDSIDGLEDLDSDAISQWVNDQFENDTDLAQQVREEFEQEYRDDHNIDEWLSDAYPRMTDIESRFDITWPHWYTEGGEGEANVEEVADEFSQAVGTKVNWSQNYHGAKRQPDRYVVEPDGSLNPDNDDDAGLEFVSPPLPLDRMLDDLDKVKAWADSRGCYTNKSTGLHINVSVPDLTTAKLDYVKLALLLGDKYVLDQFGRIGNTYAKSAMDIVKERVQQRPEDAAALLEKMKQNLGVLATKVIHTGETNKYTSINTKGGYVEFRSPGGDWLSDEFFSKIKPTLLRFIVALDAAMDPEKYREEYLKKLYQLLQPKSQTDTLNYFAKYAAGELPKAALKSFVRQAQLERKVSKEPAAPGKQYWWEVKLDNGQRMEVVAGSKEVARDVAAEEWGVDPSRIRTIDISVIKPYEPAQSNRELPVLPIWYVSIIGRPGSEVQVRADSEGNARGKAQEMRPDIFGDGSNIRASTVPVRQAAQQPAASVPSTTQDLQQQRAQGGFTGAWKIVADDGREIYRFSGVGNSQADANRVAAQWLQNNRGRTGPQTGFTVVPVMG